MDFHTSAFADALLHWMLASTTQATNAMHATQGPTVRAAVAHALHLLLKGISLWLLVSVTSLLTAAAASFCYCTTLRLRQALAGGSGMGPLLGSLPSSLVERRRGQRRYAMRLTRRDLLPADGAALESLQHAIDYLVDRYDLRRYAGDHDGDPPPQLAAVELLLQCRAALLAGHPALPSVLSLLRQRRTLRPATERR